MRGPDNYPYTNEEWWLRSETPATPPVFGLATVWIGRETDEGIEIACDSLSDQWAEMLRLASQ